MIEQTQVSREFQRSHHVISIILKALWRNFTDLDILLPLLLYKCITAGGKILKKKKSASYGKGQMTLTISNKLNLVGSWFFFFVLSFMNPSILILKLIHLFCESCLLYQTKKKLMYEVCMQVSFPIWKCKILVEGVFACFFFYFQSEMQILFEINRTVTSMSPSNVYSIKAWVFNF